MLIVKSSKTKHRISLKKYPNMFNFVMTLQGLFNGNEDYLKQYYNVAVSGSLASWKVSLTPLEGKQLSIVSVIITGRKNMVSTLTLNFENGNYIKDVFKGLRKA